MTHLEQRNDILPLKDNYILTQLLTFFIYLLLLFLVKKKKIQ
jgi:hypothetical protein